MATLNHISKISHNIKNAPVKAIKILHNLIFQSIPDDKKNRKRLREFAGFDFEEDSIAEEAKKKFIKENFSAAELFAVSAIICVDSGTKEEMINDICYYLRRLDKLEEKVKDDIRKEKEEDDENEDLEDGEEEEEEKDDVEDKNLNRIASKMTLREAEYEEHPRFSLTFRDIEGALKTFNGKDGYPVRKWIADFEETAILMGWSELQMYVFAKKSLDGLAKLFIQGERGLTSWFALKKALKEEFDVATSSAEIHKLLTQRRKKRDESLQEYFLVMKEIASRGDIEQASVWQYVIDGIDDDSGSKLLLYGAKDSKDFKEKMKSYEMAIKSMSKKIMKNSSSISHGSSRSTNEDGKQGDSTTKKRQRWGESKMF